MVYNMYVSPLSLTVGGDCRRGDENRMQISICLDRIKVKEFCCTKSHTVGRAVEGCLVGVLEGCCVGSLVGFCYS